MDLSKAFDTINHELLIAKLYAYGFSKSAVRLILSYLSERCGRESKLAAALVLEKNYFMEFRKAQFLAHFCSTFT